ncbi:MAG: transporter substrate-binding domain-containing protein [Clostridiales bacterium]|nr:transporter substrate-binding domain-containing protein [Clostridiales bacterium]
MKKIIALTLATVAACATLSLASCNKPQDETPALKLIDIELTQEEYAFAVNKNNTELLASANAYLAEIQSNGAFDAIVNKWFGDGEAPVGYDVGTYDATKDQLVVVTNTPFEPFEYTGNDGKYYGVDMELMAGFAEYLDKELCIIEHLDFDTICDKANEYPNGVVAAGLTVSADRAAIVNFTNSYYSASQKLIVAGDDTRFDNCKTAADVENILKTLDKSTTIGYQNGTTGALYVNGDEEWEFTGFNVTKSGYRTAALAGQALVNGNIQCVVVDAAPASAIVKTLNAMN